MDNNIAQIWHAISRINSVISLGVNRLIIYLSHLVCDKIRTVQLDN